MINKFKYGQTKKFGHLDLVCHFTVPSGKEKTIWHRTGQPKADV